MKTLFIGNSHTYFNDLPERFRRICQEHGQQMHVTMLTRGGIGLEDHAEEPQTRFNILFGGYDYVVLQHRAHPMGDLQDMHDGAAKILDWIRQAGSTPVFYQTWAARGEEAGQPAMSGVYARLGEEFSVRVAPVGDVWLAHRQQHPEQELYGPDGQHASEAGSQLAAQVIFDTIFPEAEKED